MSYWTKVKGVIEVDGVGRTQPEIEYILKTIIEHLPRVSGSERDMDVHLVKCFGHNIGQSHDEFGIYIEDGWCHDEMKRTELQSCYLVVVDGNMRDRYFEETYREFMKWLMRFAKRTWINECVVQVSGYPINGGPRKTVLVNPDPDRLHDLKEDPSWARTRDNMGVAWWEYLMWDRPRDAEGRLYEGKPDFPNGRWLDDMTEEEKDKMFETRGRRRGGSDK